MYTAQPEVMSGTLPDSLTEADKADGFIHLCRQSALMFGADRKKAVDYRPVVQLKSDAGRMVVLPCTSKQSQETPEHFALTASRVFWTRPDQPPGAAFWRYEVIDKGEAKMKIGTLTQSGRIDVLEWIRSKY